MPNRKIILPKKFSGSKPGLLHPREWNTLVEALTAILGELSDLSPRSSADIAIRHSGGGWTASLKRHGSGGAGASTPCPFGSIVTIPAEGETPAGKGINGGLIQIGPANFQISPEPIDLATAGEWLISISVDCVVMRDNDEEVLLPGIASATAPTGSWTKTVWTAGTVYPSTTNPEVPAGTGTVVLPIGKLTVTIPEGQTVGTPKLVATGCGGFLVSHCGGNLTHSRLLPEIPYY